MTLPQDVEIREVPQTIISEIPELSTYRYVIIGDGDRSGGARNPPCDRGHRVSRQSEGDCLPPTVGQAADRTSWDDDVTDVFFLVPLPAEAF